MPLSRFATIVTFASLVALAASAQAQTPYKVVGPDGRVTYTDRPPTNDSGSRVGAVRAPTAASDEVTLPLELRQAVDRYPVTLYVSGDDCAPCAAGRDFLRRRGVPFAERTVQTADDVAAFERLSGSHDAPTLTIGSQVLRGLETSSWESYLDAAGYPRESRLPANYRYPPATPLVVRVAPAAAAASASEPQATMPSLPVSEGPIRF